MPDLSALDTETIGGYAVILSTESETWEARSFEDCVTPLFLSIRRGDTSRKLLMWNQNFDSRAIVKYLPDENVIELLEDNQTVYNDRYKIFLIPGKILKISDKKKHITITGYDIAQFYNYQHLDEVGEREFRQGKYKSIVTETITSGSDLLTDKELYWVFGYHKDEIMHYCREDARLTLRLGHFLSDEVKELFGFRLKTFAAKTVIGKQLTRDTVGKREYMDKSGKLKLASNYPWYDPDHPASFIAQESFHGGIFDCMKRGTFGTCTDIDISSAYPFHMRVLPNLRNGKFVKVYEEDILPEDIYGWVVAEFDYPLIPYRTDMVQTWDEIHDGEVIEVSVSNTRKFYPTGTRQQAITLAEWRFLKKHGYLKDTYFGYVWRRDTTLHQYPNPFSWIDEVYRMKMDVKRTVGKESYKYDLTKKPMNSAYGTTAQKVGYPEFRNMFYASTITGKTRVQIYEMLEEIGYDSYITIATDGILIEGDIELPEMYTRGGLGSWDVNKWDSATVLGNGIYMLNKEGEKSKEGLRGMMCDGNVFKNALTKNSTNSEFIPTMKGRPVTMHQAMMWGRYTKDDMNRFVKTGRKVTCNTDTTKHWKRISNFGDLLDNQYSGRRFTIGEVDSL